MVRMVVIILLGGILAAQQTAKAAVKTSAALPDSLRESIVRMLEGEQLGEVVVKGNKPAYKLTSDGVQINVSNTPLGKVGTAEDVLRHIPGVMKLEKDKYSVFGSGEPVFYIDGRQVRDVSELSQLKSQDIASVTLITTPGARYDASVGAVVKIKTVRRQGEGLSVDEKLVWGQSSNTDITEQLNLNYHHKGLDVFTALTYIRAFSYDHSDLKQESNVGTLWQLAEELNNEFLIHRIQTDAGLNYVINADNSIGARYSARFYPKRDESLAILSTVTKDGLPYDLSYNTGAFDINDSPMHDLNAYYNGKLAGWGIDLNTSWWHYSRTNDGYYQEHNTEHADRTLHNHDSNNSTLWAAKLILSHPFLGGSVSVGTEYTNTKREQSNDNPEGYIKSNNSTQRNHTIAPFVEYTHPLPFGSVGAGLRYEHNRDEYYKNNALQDNESRTYDNLFPHLTLQAKIGQVRGTLSYRASIVRPSYKDLSESVYYINQFTQETGNSHLKPTLKHTLRAQAMWKVWSMMLGYTDTRDAILFWMEPLDDGSAVSLYSRINHNSIKSLNASVSVAPKVGLWRPQLMAVMKKQWLTLQTADGALDMSKPLFMFQSANTFSFTKTFTGELTLRLMTKGCEDNVEVENTTLRADASVTKSFLSDRLSVRLAGYDLFHSRMRHCVHYGMGYMKKHVNDDSRYAELTLRYTYNAAKSKYKGTGAGNAERRRL